MYSSPHLTIQYRPDLGLLTIRWLNEPDLEQLQAEYGAILDQARQYNSWHWLLDVRRRPAPNPEVARWVSEVWLGQVGALGLPRLPRLAYLISPAREEALRRDAALGTSVQAAYAPNRGYQLATFGDEGEATRWLLAE